MIMIEWISKDTEMQMLEIKTNRKTLLVDSKINSNWIELSISDRGDDVSIMLNDEEIKVLIEHLQRQIQ
jgi:hypothetical protein